MSRNLHMNVVKAWRIRRGERTVKTELTIDTSAFIAAMTTAAGYFAGGYDALARYVRVEEITSELTALAPDIETLEAILDLVKYGVTPREMRLVASLSAAGK